VFNFNHTRLIACLLAAATLTQLSHGAQLDPTFFPEASKHTEESIRLHGLAQLYPGTILFESPELITRSEREEAARIEKLPRSITYIRIYRLDEAIPVIKEILDDQAVILDMRYLQSPHSGAALIPLLQSKQADTKITTVGVVPQAITDQLKPFEQAPTINRRYPTVVLCNRQTAGPFEAILHSLQANGSIIAVGEATAGRTGYYKQTDNATAWMIEGELRPSSDTSLIASGFIPRIEIEGSPQKNYMSYHLYEAGTNIQRLLKDDTKEIDEHTEDTDKDTNFEPDAVLQRGVDIVAALQILQQLPDSH
jgi:hypothetical protein